METKEKIFREVKICKNCGEEHEDLFDTGFCSDECIRQHDIETYNDTCVEI